MRARCSRAATFLLAIALVLTASAHRDAAANWSNNVYDAVAVSTTSATEAGVVIASDGAGGAYFAWSDNRFGTSDLFVLRLNADGAIPAGWNANGNLICSAANDQRRPVIVADGFGGAIVAWEDERVVPFVPRPFAQRVGPNGTTSWAANGVQVGPAISVSTLKIVTDMGGGAYLAFRIGNAPMAQRITSAGTLAAGFGGVAALNLGGNAFSEMRLASDNAAGAVWAWDDAAITALRLNSSGVPAPGFGFGGTSTGVSVGSASWEITPDASGGIWIGRIDGAGGVGVGRMNGSGAFVAGAGSFGTLANRVKVAGDGAGGVMVAWSNQASGVEGIYVQRFTAGGNRPAQWLDPSGLFTRVVTPGDWEAISDGAGGLLIVASSRYEPFYSEGDLIAQHVGNDASLIAGWIPLGNPLSQVEWTQDEPVMAPDGIGGAIVAWRDQRAGISQFDLYANRLDRFGEVGAPEPRLVEARDVPADQGGQVRLRWTKSYVDSTPLNRVDAYWVWREVPPLSASAAQQRGARVLDAPTMTGEDFSALRASGQLAAGRLYRRIAETASAAATYWEWVAELGANGSPTYSYVAPTAADSVAGAPARTKWRVEALDYLVGGWESTQNLVRFWMSNVDSASSRDNLAPIVPQPFLGTAVSGNTHLHWNHNPETDIAEYRLYRGNSPLFPPDVFSLVSAQQDTGYVDVGQVGWHYKLAAIDIHGNVSSFALLTPNATTDAPGSHASVELALLPVRPNPVVAAATLDFALPRAGQVDLRIYDATGRFVRELVSGVLPAGRHQQTWDGRDRAGREVGPGFYLVRFVTGQGTRSQRVAVIR